MSTFTTGQVRDSGAKLVNHDPTKKPGRGTLHLRHVTIDFDALATSSGVALTNTDVYECIPVSAGEVIISAGINVLTACTDATDIDFGFTGGDTTAIYTAFIGNDNGEVSTTTATQADPIYVINNETLDAVVVTQSTAGGVLQFWALIARF